MSEACIKQIKYWYKTIQQLQKGIRRKNKYITRLERENNDLVKKYSHAMMRIAELELENPDQGRGLGDR